MKRVFKTMLLTTAAVACVATAAVANEQDDITWNEGRGQSMSPDDYSTMEPAAGDQTMGSSQGYSSQDKYLSNTEVRDIQRALNNEGYYRAGIDGIWGPRTTEAVRQFQEDNGLEITGTATSSTLTQLGVDIGANQTGVSGGVNATGSTNMGTGSDMNTNTMDNTDMGTEDNMDRVEPDAAYPLDGSMNQ